MNDYPIYVLCDEGGTIIDVDLDTLGNFSAKWRNVQERCDEGPLFIHEAYVNTEPIMRLVNGVAETLEV